MNDAQIRAYIYLNGYEQEESTQNARSLFATSTVSEHYIVVQRIEALRLIFPQRAKFQPPPEGSIDAPEYVVKTLSTV